MFAKRVLVAVGFCWLAGASVVALSVADPPLAYARQKSVSASLGKPLTEAQKALDEKKYEEALAKLAEADQIPKHTTYDDFIIAEFRGSAYLALQKDAEAAQAFEASYNSGELDPKDVNGRLKAIAQLYAQAGNSAKAQEFVEKYSAAVPNDPELTVLMGQLAYNKKNYADASKYLKQAVTAEETAGRKPDETWLQLLMASYYNAKDKTSYQQTLEKLVKLYPKPEYWSDLTLSILSQPNVTDARRLDVYRLKMATGGMSNEGDYVDMAEVATKRALPGDAKNALDKGYAAGKLGTGSRAAQHKRMRDEATARSAADLKSLPGVEAEAKAKPTGDPLVNIGEAYLSYGQYEKAIADVKAGLAKGGVTDPAGAKLLLGAAQVGAKQYDAAKATFGGISGGVAGSIARYWLLYLDSPKA